MRGLINVEVKVLKLIKNSRLATINQMFQLNLLQVLQYPVLCFSFSDVFAKRHVFCSNDQGGMVFPGKQESDQLKMLIVML